MVVGMDNPDRTAHECRLCGGPTEIQFEKRVLKKYSVAYSECQDCGSLQTDPPFWLGETYDDPRPVRDVGMVYRSVRFARLTSLLGFILGIGADVPCLDWGGGNGLFCRSMRDRKFNYFCYDKYIQPFYSVGFTCEHPEPGRFALVTAFEVFEHLPNPDTDLKEIFGLQPDVIMFSTLLYNRQGDAWPYLGPERGGHVFFYTARALAQVGANEGYDFLQGTNFHIFLKNSPRSVRASAPARMVIGKLLRRDFVSKLAPICFDIVKERGLWKRHLAERRAIDERFFR